MFYDCVPPNAGTRHHSVEKRSASIKSLLQERTEQSSSETSYQEGNEEDGSEEGDEKNSNEGRGEKVLGAQGCKKDIAKNGRFKEDFRKEELIAFADGWSWDGTAAQAKRLNRGMPCAAVPYFYLFARLGSVRSECGSWADVAVWPRSPAAQRIVATTASMPMLEHTSRL